MQCRNNNTGGKLWRRGLCAIFLLAQFSLFLVLASCSGQYKGMPRAEVLAYQSRATYGGLYDLSVAYADAINAALADDTLHPGLYADCGVALALMGHTDEACRMLNAEMKAFPESRGMVTRIKQRLMPDRLSDTATLPGDTVDRVRLALWAYDSLSALRPFPDVAPIIDSTDHEWISRQTPSDSVVYPIRLTANQKRELLAYQQSEAERLRKAHEDSVAAAKQARIDARKQLKADKEKAKKEKAKLKKKAEKEKKRLERQRQKERRQKAAEKERQRKAKQKKGGRK